MCVPNTISRTGNQPTSGAAATLAQEDKQGNGGEPRRGHSVGGTPDASDVPARGCGGQSKENRI